MYSACDWNLNMGGGKVRILITEDDRHRLVGSSPSAHIFEMCAHALEHQHLPMDSSDKLVYGFAAKGPGGLVQVYLLNKRLETVTARLLIDEKNMDVGRFTLESFVEPGVVKATDLPSTRHSVPLPPLSFNRIVLFP